MAREEPWRLATSVWHASSVDEARPRGRSGGHAVPAPRDPLQEAMRELLTLSSLARTVMARRLGLSVHDVEAMEHVMLSDGPVGPAELSRRLGVTTAAATQSVHRLVAAGHLVRGPHPDDRRRQVLAVTPGGAAHVFQVLGPLLRLPRRPTGWTSASGPPSRCTSRGRRRGAGGSWTTTPPAEPRPGCLRPRRRAPAGTRTPRCRRRPGRCPAAAPPAGASGPARSARRSRPSAHQVGRRPPAAVRVRAARDRPRGGVAAAEPAGVLVRHADRTSHRELAGAGRLHVHRAPVRARPGCR